MIWFTPPKKYWQRHNNSAYKSVFFEILDLFMIMLCLPLTTYWMDSVQMIGIIIIVYSFIFRCSGITVCVFWEGGLCLSFFWIHSKFTAFGTRSLLMPQDDENHFRLTNKASSSVFWRGLRRISDGLLELTRGGHTLLQPIISGRDRQLRWPHRIWDQR